MPTRKTSSRGNPKSLRSGPNTSSPAPAADSDTLGPDQLLTRLPALDELHRGAFRSQFTDADCAALGAKTKSAAVRDGAVAWAAEAFPALTDASLFDDIDYSPERLAWLVELVIGLDAEREKSRGKGKVQSTSRTARDVARGKAKTVRHRLSKKLARIVRGDDIARAELAGAGAAPTDRELAEALGVLASLADKVLKSKDPTVGVLAKAGRLTERDVTNARGAAREISTAKEDVALGGRAQGDRDTPAVNVIEGRVLQELLFLRDAFDEARKRGVPVPALIPRAGLHEVLARTHPKGAKKTASSGTTS